ncbi:MAG: serine/threonine protein kinase [Fibrobacteria bacterium]|nr:serine/threonine protein kinase [Fibrobacteria bacterium]
MTGMRIEEGAMIGRCRMGPLLGSGSMGVVHEAYHTTLEMRVAIKFLSPPPVGSVREEWIARFRREARLAARVNHPGVVRVLDMGEEYQHPYIVMEFVAGRTLETLIEERGRFDEHLALRVVGQIARGLQAAHGAGVVHRDLKPSNILVAPDGSMKIADLGLARDPHAAAITRPSGMVGTPHYMAPESLEAGTDPDHRVDLYALGVLLYRLVYGRLPFRGSLHQVLAGHIQGTPDWTLPDGVVLSSGTLYLIRRLMEKWPVRRLSTAMEVIQACRELLARLNERKALEDRRASAASSSTRSRFAKSLRERLRASGRSAEGTEIVHATSRERILAGLLLVLLVGSALRSCQGRHEPKGGATHPGPASGEAIRPLPDPPRSEEGFVGAEMRPTRLHDHRRDSLPFQEGRAL